MEENKTEVDCPAFRHLNFPFGQAYVPKSADAVYHMSSTQFARQFRLHNCEL